MKYFRSPATACKIVGAFTLFYCTCVINAVIYFIDHFFRFIIIIITHESVIIINLRLLAA